MRKKFFFLLIILFTSISASGQIADGITYQAVALDDKGKEIAGHDINGLIIHSKQISVRFSLLSGSPEGELLYKEVHSTYTDPHGLFTLVIGHGEVSPDGLHDKLTDINWGADKLFLMVEIDIRSKGDYKIMGIQQMMAVPFAFHSLSSSTVKYNDIVDLPQLSVVATTGNYSDLNNLPVLFDGNFNTLSNKPFIPGKTSELTNDAGFLRSYTETDPLWKAALPDYFTKSNLATAGSSQVHFLNITNKPTTLAGYGITDAISKSAPANIITTTNISNWNSAFGWGNHAGLYRAGNWVPSWNDIMSNPFTITAPANNQILRYNSSTGKWQNWTPNFLTSYTETDPRWTTASVNYYTKSNLQTSGGALVHFNNIISKPATVTGYGITDAMRTSHPANSITGTNISNWNAAFSWGSHIGLYRPVTWIPSWNDLSANPFTITAPANNQILRYNSTTGKWQNWTPDYLTGFTETDPLWASASGNYYTKSNLETGGGSRVHFSNIINKPTNLAGYGITDAMSTSHPANMITPVDIPNWRMAFSWGNHATAGYQPFIVPGQIHHYLRGDMTWQPLTADAVGLGNVENISLNGWMGSPNLSMLGFIFQGEWHAGLIDANGPVMADVIIKKGGSNNEFLKADGSTDSNTYMTQITEITDEFSATTGQTSFTLTRNTSALSKVKMYVNGVRISNTAYNVSGQMITYNPVNNGSYNLTAGDRIQFDYSY